MQYPSFRAYWDGAGSETAQGEEEELEHSTLAKEFKEFNALPENRYAVMVRRYRAQQVESYLRNTVNVDLETFNREVWLLGNFEVLQRSYKSSDEEERRSLERDLEEGRAEVYGNSVWRPPTNIFFPQTKDEEARRDSLRRLHELLVTSNGSPVELVEKIVALPGFGEATATGLAMLLHPTAIAVKNRQSEGALKHLGFSCNSAADFQEVIADLRELVGAEDYLELDLFLYRLNQEVQDIPSYWWVNQGRNYEKESRGGYIWANKYAINGRSSADHKNVLKVRQGDTIFHYANGTLRAVGEATSAGHEITSEEGESAFQADVTYRPLDTPVPLNAIPESVRVQQGGPFNSGGGVKQGYLYPVSTSLARVLKNLIGEGSSNVSRPNAWIFQANPKFWPLAEKLLDMHEGDEDRWSVTRYKDEIRPGDTVLLWQAGPQAGIYAVGRVTSEVYEGEPGEHHILQGNLSGEKHWVQYSLTRILHEPIRRQDLLQLSELQNLQILKSPTGTNFKVTPEEWKNLLQLIENADKGMESSRIYKIAPGENARYWRDCLEERYICVGWDELGDLRAYPSKEAFRQTFQELFPYGGNTSAVSKKASELWTLLELKEGDRIVANQGTRTVLAVGRVANPGYEWRAEREAFKHTVRVEWDTAFAGDIPPEPSWAFSTVQKLEPEVFERISVNWQVIDLKPSYSLEECAAETHLAVEELGRWVRALERKGQAVLYGPPGTGKTYLAERLAKHLVGGGDGFTDLVQFHPAYTYEDFIQGIRPQTREEGGLDYPLVPGRFLTFCEQARRVKGRCVLIIDEINRANLSQVFGELMYLLEYRGKQVPLAGGGSAFSIPENARIMGTMNTADRSIALVDHALRRRFAFLALYPNYEVLHRYHQGTSFRSYTEPLVSLLERLNRVIDDPHVAVGTSFFLTGTLSDDLESIWTLEIEPYLEELFFDHPERLEAFRWDRVRNDLGL